MPHTLLLNPRNNTAYFGVVPECRAKRALLPSGPIVLKQGRPGPKGGFGARHIWWKHQTEIIQAGLSTENDIPEYISRIVRAGSPIHFEGDIRLLKATVVRSDTGLAVLSYDEENSYYSIITAFSAKQANGYRVGTILDYI